jgi:dirigent-like protein
MLIRRRAVAVLATAAAGLALVTPAGMAQTPGATTLTFFEPDAGSTFRIVDNAPKSPAANPQSRRYRFSAGDTLTFSSPLFDRRGGTRQGTLHAHAVVVSGRTFASIRLLATGSYVLADGSQIEVTGVVSLGKPSRFAIVGGSGRFASARGSVASTSSELVDGRAHAASLTRPSRPI